MKQKTINLTIKTKITLAMILLSLFICVNGIISILLFNKLDKNLTYLYDNNFMSVQYLKDVQYNLNNIKINMTLMAIPENKSKIDTYINEINEAVTEDNDIMEQYKPLISTNDENKAYQDFERYLLDYRSYRDKFYKEIKDGNYNKAEEISVDMNDIRNRMDKALEMGIKEAQRQANETHENSNKLASITSKTLIGLMILLIVLSILITYRINKNITHRFEEMKNFIDQLKSLNFSQEIKVDSKDEIGDMENSLNQMLNEVNKFIKEIQNNVENIAASCEELSATSEEVTAQTESVTQATEEIAKVMEHVNVAVQEINNNSDSIINQIEQFTNEIDNGTQRSKSIEKEAESIQNKGNMAYDNADKLFIEKQLKAKKAIEDGKIVKEVSNLAKIISNVAEQTNLLALNAMIESARAGEHGKGFAVVSNEVKKLAEQTANAVNSIQITVEKVQSAFSNLEICTNELLTFVDEDVRNDYKLLIEVANDYSNVAKNGQKEYSTWLDSISSINNAMNEISNSIENIVAMTEETNANTETILDNLKETVTAISDVSSSTQDQAVMSEHLSQEIGKFKV